MRDDFQLVSEVATLRREWDTGRTQDHIRALAIWSGKIQICQKFGGLQNRTYLITDGDGKRYVVRCGFDQYRTRQTSVVQCTIAAANLGIGPQLRYAEPNLTITDFVTGPRLPVDAVTDRKLVAQVIQVMKRMHTGSAALGQTISYWWVFDTVRRYLRTMEQGHPATAHRPSEWLSEVGFFREVTDRLERSIGPFKPCFTHNDLQFVNMMWSSPTCAHVWLIDWDGGAYGHPMSDLAEMSLFTGVDDEFDLFALESYCGPLAGAERARRVREHRAFKIMASLRLMVEVMVTAQDPYFYLTPAEMAESMRVSFPDQQEHLNGLIDLLRPGFESMWAAYGSDYE